MIEIEKLTTWNAGREVRTQNGPRILRKGPLTAEYRAAWRVNKEAMKAVGLSMGPVDRNDPQGEWEAIWWQPIDGELARKRDEAVEASRATDAAVDIPAPDGLAYMPFQKAGIAFAKGKSGVLLADEMGLGKTIQAIGIINADPSIKRVLVVCPASLKVNWRNELNKWLVRAARVAIQNAGQSWAGSVADIIVINYDILGKFTRHLMAETWDLLVADECFVAGTKIAMADGTNKAIEDVNIGDRVLNAVGVGVVRNIGKRTVHKTVKVKTSAGDFECTPDHLVLTDSGWREAHSLYISGEPQYIKTHEETLCIVRSGIRGIQNQAFLWDILLGEMEDEPTWSQENVLRRMEEKMQRCFDGGSQKEPWMGRTDERHDDQTKPDEESDNKKPSEGNTKSDRPQAMHSRRERNWTDESRVRVAVGISADGEQLSCASGELSSIPNIIQGGRRVPIFEDSCRVRRGVALLDKEADRGQEERIQTPRVRVVGVEIREYEDPKRHSNGVEGIEVYNLEVSNHPSYVLADSGIVVHNCQYAKNPQAQRTKLLVGAQRKADREKYPGIRAVRKVCATGTPILNKPIELFPILDYIAPGQWGFRDKIRYCNGYEGRWGLDFTGHAHEEEFQRRLRETVMVRRLKRDVLTELPAKRRQIIELDAGDAASLCTEEVDLYDGNSDEIEAASADKVLAEAADDEEAYKNAVARLRSAQKVAFERISKVRHEVALAKVEQAVDHVMDVLESTPKLVVFAHHLDVIARIDRELKERLQSEGSAINPVCVVTGQTPVGERQGIVDLFNGDPGKRALILGIHAAGVGLSVKAAVEVFVELDWVPGILSQAEDRCHGIGRGVEGEPLLVQHLVLEGSLDSRMAKIVVAKQDVADRMLDKDTAKLATSDPVTALDIEFDADKIRREDANAEDPELHDVVLRGLQMLAGVCDGAAMRDDMGFNGCDARIGHSLARLSRLSPKQVALGRRLLIKYRRQLPDEVNAKVRGKDD